MLETAKRRHEDDMVAVIKDLEGHEATKRRIAKEKAKEKKELNEHGRVITETLGKNDQLVPWPPERGLQD